MENFSKKLAALPPNERGEEEEKEEKRGPRFSENLPTLLEPLIYQPRPSRTRSESLSNHARRLTQGVEKGARHTLPLRREKRWGAREEHREFMAGRTRKFVVDDGEGKKNLARRGTPSLPILTTVVVLCKLDVVRRRRRRRFASPKNLPESMENLDSAYIRVASSSEVSD